MTNVESIANFTITVFTRHTAECPEAGNPQWNRCDCRKSLYIREGRKDHLRLCQHALMGAAERVAQAERDKRDPVKIELQNIAEQEAAKAWTASRRQQLEEEAIAAMRCRRLVRVCHYEAAFPWVSGSYHRRSGR